MVARQRFQLPGYLRPERGQRLPVDARRVYSAEGHCAVSSNGIGVDGKWPRLPKFDTAAVPPGGDQSITLTEEDERMLDQIWAEVRSRPTKVFGGTLPPLPRAGVGTSVLSDGTEHLAPAATGDGSASTPAPNGVRATGGSAKRRRKAAPSAG
jgi:hypothetical protein